MKARRILAGTLALAWTGLCLCRLPESAADEPLHRKSVWHFATLAEAREFLGTSDRFLESLSPFDRQARVETDRAVSPDEFVTFVREHAREWTAEEREKLTAVAARLREKLAAFHLPFPPAVWLIKTTGREEGGAAYCRRHAVVLPASKLAGESTSLERLLTHELFHILSSHQPRLRQRAYAFIGFDSISPPTLPPAWSARRITNPDAPRLDAVIHVNHAGERLSTTPLLYSSQPAFDPQRGGPFFKYLEFRLLVLENVGQSWQPRMRDGLPWLLDPSAVPDYGRQIGNNTKYILHPDEILADNFVHLVHRTPDLPNPEIVARLGELLREVD